MISAAVSCVSVTMCDTIAPRMASAASVYASGTRIRSPKAPQTPSCHASSARSTERDACEKFACSFSVRSKYSRCETSCASADFAALKRESSAKLSSAAFFAACDVSLSLAESASVSSFSVSCFFVSSASCARHCKSCSSACRRAASCSCKRDASRSFSASANDKSRV